MKSSLTSAVLLLLLTSCSKSSKENTADIINKAYFFLSTKECTKAIDTLKSISYQRKNPDYILAYTSALACKANYSTISFFLTDLSKMEIDITSFFKSLATLSTSRIIDEEDEEFHYLKDALKHLLHAGGISRSSHDNRLAVKEFSIEDVTRFDIFALYLSFIQLGRMISFFGNAATDGTKGGGDQENNCYLTYTDTRAILLLSGSQNSSCQRGEAGHVVLDDSRELQCYGIVLFNNFIDILKNLTLTKINVKNIRTISSILEAMEGFCSQTNNLINFGKTCMTKTLERCVKDTNYHSSEHIQRFYAAIYELLHQ